MNVCLYNLCSVVYRERESVAVHSSNSWHHVNSYVAANTLSAQSPHQIRIYSHSIVIHDFVSTFRFNVRTSCASPCESVCFAGLPTVECGRCTRLNTFNWKTTESHLICAHFPEKLIHDIQKLFLNISHYVWSLLMNIDDVHYSNGENSVQKWWLATSRSILEQFAKYLLNTAGKCICVDFDLELHSIQNDFSSH